MPEKIKIIQANITNGGGMKPYSPTKEQIQMARDICKN